MEKTATNPNNYAKKVPVRYRMSSLGALDEKFVSESMPCSFSHFKENCPYFVKKPNANNWGTCPCRICLNPELKLVAVSKAMKDNSLKWDDSKDYQSLPDLIAKIETITYNSSIEYCEWQMVKNNEKKGEQKISRKNVMKKPYQKFKKQLVKELHTLQDHLHRVHSQYKAFKMAREEASSNQNVATIQVDWSENAKMCQSRKEKSVYYHEDSVCLHPMHIWTMDAHFPRLAISDITDHKASVVMPSLYQVFEDLYQDGIWKINIISDSPTSQYRNRHMVWLLQSYCGKRLMELKWIYLESGYGKGIPLGIRATVKRAIGNILFYNPHSAIYSVQDMLFHKLQDHVPSVTLHVSTEKEINDFESSLPLVQPIKGMMKIHEVHFQFEEQKITVKVKDESIGKSRKIMLLSCQGVAKLKSSQYILTDKNFDDDEDETEETEESYGILFYILTSKEYFVGQNISFCIMCFKKEEKQY